MIFRWSAMAAAGLALAGCNDRTSETDSAPDPTDTETPALSDTQPVSIIRPDVEVEREIVPLEPLKARIGFPEGGYDLNESALEELQTVLDSRQMEAGGAIVLGGHTDSAGNDRANLRASQMRAEAVRDWLTEQGVKEERIKVIAFGEQNPVEPNAKADGEANEPGRAANRRVTVSIAVPKALSKPVTKASPTLIEQVSADG